MFAVAMRCSMASVRLEYCFKEYPKGRRPLAQEGFFSGNGVEREENALMSYGISRNVRFARSLSLLSPAAYCECLHALFLSLEQQTCSSEELP